MKKVKKSLIVSAGIVCLLMATLLGFAVRDERISLGGWPNDTPVIFSTNRMLLELWSTYKRSILEPGSLRALDKSQNNITTSEGQSYTMLRAVWIDDQETFRRTWQWTKDNMQRSDHLMAWKFGEIEKGKYGIQTAAGGNNTATDGDTDIAFALLMAAERWKEPLYLYDAQDMLASIWEKEVVVVGSKPILAANDIERLNKESILVNPSYLSPYAYKVFAKVDPAHDWLALANSSYDILFAASDTPLDKKKSVGLTPNWIRINRITGQIKPASALDSNYGYDAFRTPWRMALDWVWNKDTRAKQMLGKHDFLADEWRANGSLKSVYSHNGETIAGDQAPPAAYGANLAYFMIEEPALAKNIYETKLLTLYNADTQSWRAPLNYYDDNWAWFGIALYENNLPNLTEHYE